MTTVGSSAPERRATNRLFAAYLIVAAVPLLFAHRPASWPLLLLLHIGVAFLALKPSVLSPVSRSAPRFSEIIADWYPLLLIPALYTELATLNVSIWNGGYFDKLIQGWEGLIFGGQPSRELAAMHPILWLSEVLHASYVSYYLIIFGPPIVLYLMGKRSEHRHAVFAVMLAFFVHYLFFIFFPVQGPRYLWPAPGGPIADGSIYQLTHRLLETGSSRGAAFPSSHVGVSVAQTIMTMKYLPRLSPLLVVLTLGLAIGAVYGGFHYAIDVCTGLILGILAALLAPSIERALSA